jgi:hypothetical protein
MARRPSARSFGNIILVVLLGGVLVTQALQAVATHQPANKAASSASNFRDITGINGQTTTILRETMKVSDPVDLILQNTLECALVTEVTTGDEEGMVESPDSAEATAQIEVRVKIDGTVVPVESGDADPNTAGNQPKDDGWVVFCNRQYGQTATDQDGDMDVDRYDSYIRTRTANAFNWFAFDVGRDYDSPTLPADDNNNNIVEVVVEARWLESAVPADDAKAEAMIGRRSIIVEPTHASNHEQTSLEA